MTAERTSLREYQRSLAARLAQRENAHTVSKLGVRAAGGDWLVDLTDAGEVLPVPALTRVPHTRSWFAGVANVRGNLYSVIDFSAFLGAARTTLDSQSRLLLIAEKHRINCGLIVQAVVRLYRDEELTRVDTAPDTPWVSAQYTDVHGGTWKHLDITALIAHQDFLQVGH